MKQTKPAQAMELRTLSPVFGRLRRRHEESGMRIGRSLGNAWLSLVGILAVSAIPAAGLSELRRKPGIAKLECRSVNGESSIRISAHDLAGKPAEGLWIDAISKAYGREQSIQIDGTGVGKVWVARDRTYEVHAYGPAFDGYFRLRDIRVQLGCELQVRVTAIPSTGERIIIY